MKCYLVDRNDPSNAAYLAGKAESFTVWIERASIASAERTILEFSDHDFVVVQEYWTVLVPYVGREFRTEWHPDRPDGPFAVLTRGDFNNETDAIQWAREHLNGTPYSLKHYIGPTA